MSLLPDLLLEDYFVAQYEARVGRLRAMQRLISPAQVYGTAQIADHWPDLPAPAVVAAGIASAPYLPATAPVYADLTRRQVDDQVASTPQQPADPFAGGFWSDLVAQGARIGGHIPLLSSRAVKGTLRVATTAWDAVWNEAVARPFKTAMNMVGMTDQGAMGLVDAWQAAGASQGSEAVVRFLRDPWGNLTPFKSSPNAEVNLGEGLLPHSDPRSLGENLTELGLANTTQLTRGGRAITPGRVLADFSWLEPGTAPYNMLSGAIDAGIMLYADPSTAFLKSVGAVSRGTHVFAGLERAVGPTARLGGILPDWTRGVAGLVYSGARRYIHGPTTEGWLTSTASNGGRRLAMVLDDAFGAIRGGDDTMLANMVDQFSKYGPGIDRRFFARGVAGESATDLLREQLGLTIREIPMPGGVSRRVGQILGGEQGAVAGGGTVMRRWTEQRIPGFDRTFRAMSDWRGLNVENRNAGFLDLNQLLHNAGLDPARRGHYLGRWMNVDDLAPTGDLERIADDLFNEMGDNIVKMWEGRGLGADELGNIGRLVDASIRHPMTDMAKWRAYLQDGLGRDAFAPGVGLNVVEGVGAEVEAAAHTITEMITGYIPTPDARMVRNALSHTRQLAVARLPKKFFESPLGNNIMQQVMDPFMSHVWRPWTLVRSAWFIRFGVDEMARMSVQNLDTLLKDPMSAMAWMISDPNANLLTRALREMGYEPRGWTSGLGVVDKRGLPIILDDPAIQKQLRLRVAAGYRESMMSRHGDALMGMSRRTATKGGDEWRAVDRTDYGHATGMSHVMFQNAGDPVMRMLAGTDRQRTLAWLNSAAGRRWRATQVTQGRLPNGSLSMTAEAMLDDPYMNLVVGSYDYRLAIHSGGRAHLTFDGHPVDIHTLPPEVLEALDVRKSVRPGREWQQLVERTDPETWRRLQYVIDDPGSLELRQAVAEGGFQAGDGSWYSLLGDADNPDATFRALDRKFRSGAWKDLGPDNVKAPIEYSAAKQSHRISSWFYHNFAGRPSDFFNRSPAWRQFYWQRYEELLGFTDNHGRDLMYASAVEAKLGEPTLVRWRETMGKLEGHEGPLRALREPSYAEVERVADQYATVGYSAAGERMGWTARRKPVILDLDQSLPGVLRRRLETRIGNLPPGPERDAAMDLIRNPRETGSDIMRTVETRHPDLVEGFGRDIRDEGYVGYRRVAAGPQADSDIRWVTDRNLISAPVQTFEDISDQVIPAAHDLAAAFATEGTRELLYDASLRSNFMDMYRNLFPFGEAFVEIARTWARLVKDNPYVLRRGQQMVEGARNSGFFTKDENGVEMFNYPGGSIVNHILFGGPSAELKQAVGLAGGDTGRIGIRMQGRVAGLNLVSGQVLPGFGPVAQLLVGQLRGTKFDTIRNIVVPYGAQDLNSPGDALDSFLPPWLRRVTTAVSGGTANAARVQENSAIDVFKALVIQGADVSTPEAYTTVMRYAHTIANKLTLIKAIGSFSAPASPDIEFYVVPDTERTRMGDSLADEVEGRVWTFQTLGGAWRELLDKYQGDEVPAFDEFWRKYGVDPTLFATSKSTVISPRSTYGEEGDAWGRNHPDLFTVAPYTAYYAHPDDPTDVEFNYDAYVRSLQEGARIPLTLEQWQSQHNDTLGRIRYEKARREIDKVLGPDSSQRKTEAMRIMRLYLMDQHPGYRLPNPGAPERASIDQKIEELAEVWPRHPELADSETGRAVARYLRVRQLVIDKATAMGIVEWQRTDATRRLRDVLRLYATRLMRESPAFAKLWRMVLEHELNDDLGPTITLATG